MGAAYIEYEKICRTNKVAVFSSNYRLYGDMSNRVMCTLRKFSPDVEIYPIDEAFMRLDILGESDIVKFCADLREKIRKWTGIPVTIGIGHSKTLAKAANHYAKKNNLTVFDIRDKQLQEDILAKLEVGGIWGIGRRISIRLKNIGIDHALKLREANPKLIRKQFGVIGEKIVYELRGLSCITLEVIPNPKKNIVSAKSFGRHLTQLEEIEEALAHYTAMTCVKMRAQGSKLHGICVFVATNHYIEKENFYRNSSNFYFDQATADTIQIIKYAKQALNKIFKPGHKYKKVGIMLLDLVDESYNQCSMLSNAHLEIKSSKIMSLMDAVNERMGRNTVYLAAQGIQRTWQSRAARKSKNFVGDWSQLMEVK